VQNGIDIGVVVLLVILAVDTFRKRGESEPPRWMGKLENATGRLSFVLGFLLLGFFPADLLTSIAVGAHLGGHADPWWHAGLFVLATLFLLAIPALLVLVLGKRAAAVLPAIRDWLHGNAWLVSEAVIAFFLALTIMGLTGGLAPAPSPPAVCEAHHLIPWAQGGPTSLGWKITRHPDGTTTATSPDGRILHSHSPPRQMA
jgi:hypothetical protein